MKNNITQFIKREPVLIIALVLALITSFISIPKLEYIDFKVLILLFNLMIIVAAYKKLKLLDSVAIKLLSKCTSYKSITITLVLITFFSSMFLTNDVSLITFVPLTLIISEKANIEPIKIIVLQTIAANLGSSLTPMGNPQNLYLYSFFNLTPMEFFKITIPLVLISLILIMIPVLSSKNVKSEFKLENITIENKKKIFIYTILFLVILLSVFHIVDYKITLVLTILVVLILDKSLFKDVDYALLLTFIAFFIFIGNISSMAVVKEFMIKLLSTKRSTYFTSIAASQFISNVPATMLISPFTSFARELILGVNIGGLGTLIASLASLISYKLYSKENPTGIKEYIKEFTIYNVSLLVVLTAIFLFI